MSDKQKIKAVGKRGCGSVMLAHLEKVDHASTTELAELAGVDIKKAYSRLQFLETQEGVLSSVGKGDAKVWSLTSKADNLPAATPRETASIGGNRSHGWKPSVARYASLEGDVEKGDKLLVEYPEEWRHSMLCFVTRPSDYFGEEGLAQVWNARDRCYSVVDVKGYKERGWKVVRVDNKKEFASLMSA